MTVLLRLALASCLSLIMTGCIYINDEEISADELKGEQVTNRETISNLSLGLSATAVIQKLGTATESEAFMDDGEEVRVLFYRTGNHSSDNGDRRNDMTPLIFRNDQLIGWGKNVYEKLE